jgi:hypothetical protein
MHKCVNVHVYIKLNKYVCAYVCAYVCCMCAILSFVHDEVKTFFLSGVSRVYGCVCVRKRVYNVDTDRVEYFVAYNFSPSSSSTLSDRIYSTTFLLPPVTRPL